MRAPSSLSAKTIPGAAAATRVRRFPPVYARTNSVRKSSSDKRGSHCKLSQMIFDSIVVDKKLTQIADQYSPD